MRFPRNPARCSMPRAAYLPHPTSETTRRRACRKSGCYRRRSDCMKRCDRLPSRIHSVSSGANRGKRIAQLVGQGCEKEILAMIRFPKSGFGGDPRDACLSMAKRFSAGIADTARWLAADCRRLPPSPAPRGPKSPADALRGPILRGPGHRGRSRGRAQSERFAGRS